MSIFRILRPSARFAVCSQYRAYAQTAAQSTGAQHSQTPEKTSKASSPASSTTIPQSSCPADTILPGLNYLKDKPPVLALPDEQYPEWLWTILVPKVYPDDGPGGLGEKIRMRKERKRRIKELNFMATQ